MTMRGKIKKGKVLLDHPTALPDGTLVEIRLVKKTPRPKKTAKKAKPPERTRAERYAPFIGAAKGLPPDMSENLDHYLYGLPKQK